MVGIAARPATTAGLEQDHRSGFAAYGTPSPDVADPTSNSIKALINELETLRDRVKDLETEKHQDQLKSVAADKKNGDAE